MKKVVFYNFFHNGDIHVSRGIVKQIINKVHQLDPSIEFVYSHKNDPTLLADIANLGYDREALNHVNPHDGVVVRGDTAYINTWYDQQHQKYARQWGVLTIDTLYIILNEACKQLWGFTLPQCSEHLVDFFPSIDYSKFYIENAKLWVEQQAGKKVLVENGQALSKQAHNFDMTSIVVKLAYMHPEITFILSQKEDVLSPLNAVYTTDVIQKPVGSDLNEISYLSTHCDMIIGRSSGVFSFSMVKENMFERDIKLLSFSHSMSKQRKFWLGSLFTDRIDYSSQLSVSNEFNVDKVLEIINGSLQ
jgi:hypothetical protein